jgi:hypothetical protein
VTAALDVQAVVWADGRLGQAAAFSHEVDVTD